LFSNKTYNILKAAALIWLPALTTLYYAVASIWGLPDTQHVLGTITAVDAFLGVVLGISTATYKPPADGEITVDPTGLTGLKIPLTAGEIAAKKIVTLVIKQAEAAASDTSTTKGTT
jgi:Putative phage holin Dp-1